MAKDKIEQDFSPYSQSLLNIVKGKALYGGNTDQAFHEITEAAANTLGVERASIWMFADNGSKIHCTDLYERGPHRHSEGLELTAADHPAYFAAMEEDRAIEAHDAHNDPRTCEFSEPYLTPLGITSMLDAPIHFDGRTVGVICHEHVGQARHWRPEEINYAGSLADLISHALEARDRAQAEAALRKSETRARAAEQELLDAIESISEGFVLFDADGRMVLCNRKYKELYGYSDMEAAPGVHTRDLGKLDIASGRVVLGAKDTEAYIGRRDHPTDDPSKSYTIHLADGRYLLTRDRRTAEGGTVSIQADITEGKRAETEIRELNEHLEQRVEERTRELRESERRFMDFASVASDWFWEMDSDLRFINVSEKYFKITGREPEDIIGKTRYETADPGTLDSNPKTWERHIADLESRRAFSGFEMSSPGGKGSIYEGERYWVSLSGTPWFDEDGNFMGYRGTATDITAQIRTSEELKRAHDTLEDKVRQRTHELTAQMARLEEAEKQLNLAVVRAEEANQAKSEFLATMSHELRTPLNAILGFADILSHQYLGPLGVEKYVEYADDIHASGKYLLELVNDVLDIATIEAGKRSLAREMIPLAETIAECMKAIAGEAEKRGIEVSTRGLEDLQPLYAEMRAIKQILLNLLSNALKFTPDGGKITVSVKASKRNTTIKVSDTGVGIGPKYISTVMAPFEQGESDPYVTHEGAGLGLAITHSLVELHDGTLHIESTVGKGTTVTVTLPNGGPGLQQ